MKDVTYGTCSVHCPPYTLSLGVSIGPFLAYCVAAFIQVRDKTDCQLTQPKRSRMVCYNCFSYGLCCVPMTSGVYSNRRRLAINKSGLLKGSERAGLTHCFLYARTYFRAELSGISITSACGAAFRNASVYFSLCVSKSNYCSFCDMVTISLSHTCKEETQRKTIF